MWSGSLTHTLRRSEFDRIVKNSDIWEVSEEDLDGIRAGILEELSKNSPYNMDEFELIMEAEMSVFKSNEHYDYVTDMRRAYSESLGKSNVEKIFETIPDYMF